MSPTRIRVEDAAGDVARIRRDYRKLYLAIARGDGSPGTLRTLRGRRAELKLLLANLDGSARPTWLKLVGHFDALEERLGTSIKR